MEPNCVGHLCLLRQGKRQERRERVTTADYGSEGPKIARGAVGEIRTYATSPTVLTLKDHRNVEFALWRNAEMKFEMNLLGKACFISWKRDVALPRFT